MGAALRWQWFAIVDQMTMPRDCLSYWTVNLNEITLRYHRASSSNSTLRFPFSYLPLFYEW